MKTTTVSLASFCVFGLPVYRANEIALINYVKAFGKWFILDNGKFVEVKNLNIVVL